MRLQEQPDKAVAEVQQAYNRAKRRQKAAKDEAKAAAAHPQAQAHGADGANTAAAAAAAAAAAPQSQAAQGPRAASRPLSPAPSGAATAPAAAAAAAGPVSTPGKARGSQHDSDTATDDEGAEPGKEAAGAAGAEDGTQGSKTEFSQWQGGVVSCRAPVCRHTGSLLGFAIGQGLSNNVLLLQCDCWRGSELEQKLSMSCRSCQFAASLPTTHSTADPAALLDCVCPVACVVCLQLPVPALLAALRLPKLLEPLRSGCVRGTPPYARPAHTGTRPSVCCAMQDQVGGVCATAMSLTDLVRSV